MTIRYAATALIAGLALAAPVYAQPAEPPPELCSVSAAATEMDHSAMGHDMGEQAADDAAMAGMDMAAPSEGHAAMMAGMDAMNSQMMGAMMAEDFDVAFICGMIPHHLGAIGMAEAALEYSEDPFVRELAGEIVAAQEAEIAEMTEWLEARQ